MNRGLRAEYVHSLYLPLTDYQDKLLKTLAVERGISRQELIRQALAEKYAAYLSEREDGP